MPQFRVFISHSARDDDHATKLLNELRAGLEAVKDAEGNQKFGVLIDKDDLELGVLWRQTLNTWIGGCDVAIALLTKKALKSDYVQYETTVLRYRETSTNNKCTLIPVLVSPVNAECVNKTQGYKASQITEAQGIVLQDISDPQERAKVVEDITKQLETLERNASPLEPQELFLEQLFQKVPEQVVKDALEKLNVDLGGWGLDVDPRRALSLAMLCRGLDDTTADIIVKVRSKIRSRADLETLFETLATSWIDLRSTRRLGTIALLVDRNARVVALDGSNDFIAGKYVSRASPDPEDPWHFAPVTAAFAERAPEELTREIEAAIRRKMCLRDEDDLQTRLQGQEKRKYPVIVAIPAGGVTRQILNELRLKFPSVTFFLLAGQDENVLQAVGALEIEFLLPLLTSHFKESEVVANYQNQQFDTIEIYLRQNGL